MIAKLTKKFAQTTVQSKNDRSDEDRTTDYDTDNDIKPNRMQKEYETLNRVYVNPMIAELKQTNVNLPLASTFTSDVVIRWWYHHCFDKWFCFSFQNVKEMYALAEKIVGNNIDKYLYDASKSTDTSEELAAQP